MTDCNKETIALTVPKSMYHKKLPKHWFKALQIDTKHLSKFGRNFISDYNLARRSLVEVSSKLRPLEWMDNLENSDYFLKIVTIL